MRREGLLGREELIWGKNHVTWLCLLVPGWEPRPRMARLMGL